MDQNKAKTRTEIADLYGINRKTLYRWLKKAGIVLDKGRIKPKDQKLIFEKFGDPEDKQQDKKK